MAGVLDKLRSIVEGALTILGRLAASFRLGPRAAVQPTETPTPGRERLSTVPEIIATLAARRELPTPEEGTRLSYSYVCVWYDAATGDRISGTRYQIEASPGTAYQVISGRVRAYFNRNMPRCVRSHIEAGGHVTRRCFQLGRPTEIRPES